MTEQTLPESLVEAVGNVYRTFPPTLGRDVSAGQASQARGEHLRGLAQSHPDFGPQIEDLGRALDLAQAALSASPRDLRADYGSRLGFDAPRTHAELLATDVLLSLLTTGGPGILTRRTERDTYINPSTEAARMRHALGDHAPLTPFKATLPQLVTGVLRGDLRVLPEKQLVSGRTGR